MKTYLPNVLLRMRIDRDECDVKDYTRRNFFGHTSFIHKVLFPEKFLDSQLVFRFFLLDLPQETGTVDFFNEYFALSTLHRIEWVGDRPSDEIIVLLRLLVVEAFHLSRSMLETAGSHLLCSSLDLIWYDYLVYRSEDNPKKMKFVGNVVEFLATIFFTSPAALLSLLENYYDDFAQSVDLSGILQSFQTSRRETDDWLRELPDWDHFSKEAEVTAKVVQKLQNMGAVSIDEDPESDLEPNAGSTTEPTVESGMESHYQPKRWLDIVLRNERKEEIES